MKISIVVGLIVISMLIGCAEIEHPVFRRIEGIEINEIHAQLGDIAIGITYFNPNNFSVTVKETALKMYVDSAFFGEFLQDSAVVVGEESEFTIPLSASISVANLLKMNPQNFRNDQVIVEATGKTRIGKAGIFITQPVSYRGSHTLKELLRTQKIPQLRD